MKNILHKITHWEAWPFKLIYAPLVPIWGWYMLRSGAVWFFTSSNPKLTFGGMEGEPKREMYDLLPADLYPTTFNVLPADNFQHILQRLREVNIDYPFIVKPEVGGQGILFRKIDNEADLLHYHSNVPVEYIVQRMVHYPIEVSVFHIRYPNQQKGVITGFLHKIPLQVTGDGKHTLEELILLHPKAAKRTGELHSKHKEKWRSIIPAGERYILSYAANHNRGAHFVDLKEYINDDLLKIFDNISLGINDFFYGRYDIMCSSIEGLQQGKDFTILEYNGCGAEPNHFYDTGYTLRGAYREILKHWKALFEISKYNREKGIAPWPFWKGVKFRRDTLALYETMKKADERIG
ncbi:MAG: hypothetical protein JWQ27_3307 [Ferruginibacter sp.]|nr:hypothetical protein [Ferruginibacter sp.]